MRTRPSRLLPSRLQATLVDKVAQGSGKKLQGARSTNVHVHALLADLKACSIKRNLVWGKKLHAKVLESGDDSSTLVATALVNMYAKCWSMVEARQVFDNIRQPDVVSWNALLLGYVANGEGLTALDLFSRMKFEGCTPDAITYMAALKACASLALKYDGSQRLESLERGKQIHLQIRCELTHSLRNTLIDMYAKCGSMVAARHVFDSITHPDVVSWNALLLGYADDGQGLIALELFSSMKAQGCTPDSITYVAALKACASLALEQDGSGKAECFKQGKLIHTEVGCVSNLSVQNTLIDMYAKCGSIADAHRVFDSIRKPDVVSWNALLLGYAESGEGLVVLDLFSKMKSQGCAPVSVTYVAALKAVASLALQQDANGRAEYLGRGKEMHSQIGSQLTPHVQTTLIDMYAKCGSMVDAHQVFDTMRQPDVASWNALLLGYADNGKGLVALDLLSSMKSHGCAANSRTYLAALRACGLLGALEFGRKVHAEIGEFNTILVTCLVDFYAKCGSLVEAQAVFDLHCKTRDIATWNALLAGYCNFGVTDRVFGLFERMQDAGFRPDGITLKYVLMCCSHAGLVGKAREYLQAMAPKYKVTPCIEHYTCLVDALGRANKLDDAIVLLQRMSSRPNVVTWTTVLSACHKWKNVEIGKLAFQSLVSLDEGHAAAYVLMSQIYASRRMWEERDMVLDMRKMSKSQDWPSGQMRYTVHEDVNVG